MVSRTWGTIIQGGQSLSILLRIQPTVLGEKKRKKWHKSQTGTGILRKGKQKLLHWRWRSNGDGLRQIRGRARPTYFSFNSGHDRLGRGLPARVATSGLALKPGKN